jgi:glycolate oxidase
MAIEREAYRALEAVVEPRNISEDPAVLDSYIWQWPGELHEGVQVRFLRHRPVAVALPASTEEVQAIARVCNRYGLKFRAFSTGWGAWGAPKSEGVVQLDLRRMDRMRELNERDMYAVVEPYFIWARLQAESMKRGLNCSIIGAGSNTSPLASCTSMEGAGYNSHSMGYNNRNVLGIEWVLPNGELLKLGSLGSGSGWISGDGPGPSLRGILRGIVGAAGGFGVITAAAIRLYQWGGPPELAMSPVDGSLQELPENVELMVPDFPTFEQRDAALYEIGEAEIVYASMHLGRGLGALLMAPGRELVSGAREALIGATPQAAYAFLLVGNSRAELEYQKKVLRMIVERHGGSFSPVFEDEAENLPLVLHLIKNHDNARVFWVSGSFTSVFCLSMFARRQLGEAEKLSIQVKKKYIDKGALVDDVGEGGWGQLFDHGHTVCFENETCFDPLSADAVGGIGEAILEGNDEALRRNWSPPLKVEMVAAEKEGKNIHERLGPVMSGYDLWFHQIRRAFDPNGVADA